MLDQTRFRLKGHTLMVVAPNIGAAFDYVTSEAFTQFQIHKDIVTGEVRIGIPLPVEVREDFRWLYEKHEEFQ